MRLGFPKRQKKIRPQSRQAAPLCVPEMVGAELAAVYHGERVGGDFYDFLRASPNRILFGLLDVAGRHDENIGIVSAARDRFRELGPRLFADEDLNEADAMLELSLQLNRVILQTAGSVRSCPAFVGCYNEALGTLCFTNAGHTPALLRDQTGITRLPATGLPLGLFSHITHDASTVALRKGAALLLVSRGVTEGKRKGEEFGLDRVEAVFQQAKLSSAEQICAHVLDAVEAFTQVPPRDNDVTALALARCSSSHFASSTA
jgi:serine phosphatase RsbU (regulator of sigma subunit)